MVVGSVSSNNQRVCQQAVEIQQETLEALHRIQGQAAETEAIGITTLEELQLHREKLDIILKEGDRLHEQLDTAERLQNRFSLWNLNLNNRRKAVRDTKQNLKEQKAKAKAEKERSLRISASVGSTGSTSVSSSGGSSMASGNSTVKVKHTSSLVKSRPKKNAKPTTCDNGPKGLLYGIDTKGNENENELKELADTDKIIDKELDKVSVQLNGLLDMSRMMHAEVKTQNAAIDEVDQSLTKADYKTKVVNERGRRFLTGKPRRELDKSRALGLPFY